MKKPFIGLGNEESDMNCFLNSALQALYHMSLFSLDLSQFPCASFQVPHSCIACILKIFFSQYSDGLETTQNPIFPIEIRHKISEVYVKNFSLQEKADSMEVLNAILVGLHNAFNQNYDSIDMIPIDNCQCPVHKQLSLNFEEIHSCECGYNSIIQTCGLVQAFIGEKYTDDLIKLYEADKSDEVLTLTHFEKFTEYLKYQIEEGDSRTCDCGRLYKVKKALKSLPDYIIIQMIWKDKIFSVLQTLEFLVSLNYNMHINHIYTECDDQIYNIQGFIVNTPGHYIYVGFSKKKWWLINDEEVECIGTLTAMIGILSKSYSKIVGVIYVKSQTEIPSLIYEAPIRTYEKFILKNSLCSNCQSFKCNLKCDECGYLSDAEENDWDCHTCSAHNTNYYLRCKKCLKKKYFKRKNQSTIVSNFSRSCKTCKAILFVRLERYCYICAKALEKNGDNNYMCVYCNIIYEDNNAICYLCASVYWQCMFCDNYQPGGSYCYKCKQAKNSDVWFCKDCNLTNFIGKLCVQCEKPEPFIDYCVVCGDNIDEIQRICNCFYNFTCSVCFSAQCFPAEKLCGYCSEVLVNNYCLRCEVFIPRNYVKCYDCKSKKISNIEAFHCRTTKSMLCVLCGAFNCEFFKICWKCGEKCNIDYCKFCQNTVENICRWCLKQINRCEECDYFFDSSKCIHCKTYEFPALINSQEINQQKSTNWQCLSCNFYNQEIVLFCEKCNYCKLYSFIDIYKCSYCKEKSHNPWCKNCFWLFYCSNCDKKMYPSQSSYCSNCGSELINQKCNTCNEYVGLGRILCKVCSFIEEKCQCGRKKHPKGICCKICSKKRKITKIKCSKCKEIVAIDLCWHCGYECYGGRCENCSEVNSYQKKYLCRNCSCALHKCLSCKKRHTKKSCQVKHEN
ncbi:hypothetical protein SteCoe_30219 [Stentor coeruleus]|uniref:USP domain-containing protein n=1 Tax=Stentor coeruleus TaxID=5963 RepID=A0A1R2B472_9CILI|nr:hypothetical protein SteCoe_30219 [Stentor coeruleus]